MTPAKTRPHKPMLAEWTNEIFCPSLLVWVPHETKHGRMVLIKKMLTAMANVIKSRVLINTVPLITHRHAWAGRADARNPGICSLLPTSSGGSLNSLWHNASFARVVIPRWVGKGVAH